MTTKGQTYDGKVGTCAVAAQPFMDVVGSTVSCLSLRFAGLQRHFWLQKEI